MLCQLSYAPGLPLQSSGGFAPPSLREIERMSEQPPAPSSDEPVESGALEDEQQGKGYGADEGEREQALDEE